MKHGNRSVMTWGFKRGWGRCLGGTMKACGYTKIPADQMTPMLQNRGRRGIFQHEDNFKVHTIAQEFIMKKVKTMAWKNMLPDLNPIEHLWGDLKRKVEQKYLKQRADQKHSF